jgi:hypothetical protein
MQEEKSKPKFPLENPMFKRLYKIRRSRSGKQVFSRKKIGYLVAGIVDDEVTFGFSLCHRKDEYNVVDGEKRPHWGRSMAISRALKWKDSNLIPVPHSIMPEAAQFLTRCTKYYKDRDIPRIMPQEQNPPERTITVITSE